MPTIILQKAMPAIILQKAMPAIMLQKAMPTCIKSNNIYPITSNTAQKEELQPNPIVFLHL